jgi:hypothetical protein
MKGWIWAQSEPCLTMAKEEVRRVRRNLAAFDAAKPPPAAVPPAWWILAVLLCPGDTTKDVVAWARGLREVEVERIRFYLHPDTDAVAAFREWYLAGSKDPKTAEVEDFGTFHKQFGWDLNNQVYRDALAEG